MIKRIYCVFEQWEAVSKHYNMTFNWMMISVPMFPPDIHPQGCGLRPLTAGCSSSCYTLNSGVLIFYPDLSRWQFTIFTLTFDFVKGFSKIFLNKMFLYALIYQQNCQWHWGLNPLSIPVSPLLHLCSNSEIGGRGRKQETYSFSTMKHLTHPFRSGHTQSEF